MHRALALSSSLRYGNRKAEIADSGKQRAQAQREARYLLRHCSLHAPELAPGRSCMGPPADVWSLRVVLQPCLPLHKWHLRQLQHLWHPQHLRHQQYLRSCDTSGSHNTRDSSSTRDTRGTCSTLNIRGTPDTTGTHDIQDTSGTQDSSSA
ncbi:hypothetical protein E5288_WYG022765 [Bos mutus]|uniref:Uncharacterized protein n=1 Tax=Bos mutus TaxID=72004 RepID=A0A6B0R308_9CETA|nr:hypothetical protein [Bos mutus]